MCGTHYGIGGRVFCGGCGPMIEVDTADQLGQQIPFEKLCLACWGIDFLWGQLNLVGIFRTWVAN